MNDNETMSTSNLRTISKYVSRSWMVPLAGFSSLVVVAGIALLFTTPVQAKLRGAFSTSTSKLTTPQSATTPTPETLATPVHKLNGEATWYGSVLNGHRTASGERFNMYDLTACHPTLPFGTLVRVVDQKTHRSVVVRINDRGILSEGRIIDLSYAAAGKLGIVKTGVATVALEVVKMGNGHHHWVKDPPGQRVVILPPPPEYTASR